MDSKTRPSENIVNVLSSVPFLDKRIKQHFITENNNPDGGSDFFPAFGIKGCARDPSGIQSSVGGCCK